MLLQYMAIIWSIARGHGILGRQSVMGCWEKKAMTADCSLAELNSTESVSGGTMAISHGFSA